MTNSGANKMATSRHSSTKRPVRRRTPAACRLVFGRDSAIPDKALPAAINRGQLPSVEFSANIAYPYTPEKIRAAQSWIAPIGWPDGSLNTVSSMMEGIERLASPGREKDAGRTLTEGAVPAYRAKQQ